MRGPGRLYCFLRRFVGSKYHPSTQGSILQEHFSNYQISKYLSVLEQRKFLRRDRAGNCYLTSLYTLTPRSGRQLCISMPDDVLKDGKVWKEVIAGVVVAAYTRSLRYGQIKKRSRYYAATNDTTGIGTVYQGGAVLSKRVLANSSMVQGCALSILAKHTGRHKSTMSRWRKKGQAFGYDLGRWYYSMPEWVKVKPADLSAFREHGPANGLDPNRLVIKAGVVVEEGPTQVIFKSKLFFKK